MPDESTISRFRHRLERHKLAEQMLATVNDLLCAKGLQLKEGTIVDATLIAAPSSTKNKDKARDPEMHSSKKGNQCFQCEFLFLIGMGATGLHGVFLLDPVLDLQALHAPEVLDVVCHNDGPQSPRMCRDHEIRSTELCAALLQIGTNLGVMFRRVLRPVQHGQVQGQAVKNRLILFSLGCCRDMHTKGQLGKCHGRHHLLLQRHRLHLSRQGRRLTAHEEDAGIGVQHEQRRRQNLRS